MIRLLAVVAVVVLFLALIAATGGQVPPETQNMPHIPA